MTLMIWSLILNPCPLRTRPAKVVGKGFLGLVIRIQKDEYMNMGTVSYTGYSTVRISTTRINSGVYTILPVDYILPREILGLA